MSKFSQDRKQHLTAREVAAVKSGVLYEEVKAFLARYHLDPKKSLGQNFLISEEALQDAIDAADISQEDFVLEIGPGPGTLTRRLAVQAGAVAAIELDDKIFNALQKDFRDISNVTILHGNALEINTAQVYREYGCGLRFKIVANIPYYITSALLKHYLSTPFKPQTIVMLMQKEVALQVTNLKNRSLLSLSVQYYGQADIAGFVRRSSFLPVPKVDSAFLRIQIYDRPSLHVNEERFFALARFAFSQSRKTLLNSLAASLSIDKEDLMSILLKADDEYLKIRAGALSLVQWQKLYDIMSEHDSLWK
ncbi:MAG: 16S rRNA (adenine(1518)-N(6)/adenine(1519)-N(6))-dimethyltransferase RsmA [Chloroflexi bacterium]|nr:16S rRNA (adenine(1518)-N(6)/adenine(1519)-N(6))-dimethyltransferase RsmA [Chloroflexota bacterium]